jgi:pyridoxal phosphate enzyme (YggS family)
MEKIVDRYRRNINTLKKQVEKACINAGRDPGEITIIAATKYTGPEGVRLINRLGIDHFGENRSDELLRKKALVTSDAVWHFIGHLQSRKARDVVPEVEYIHSIDSIKILEKVGREAARCSKTQKVLIEVNISGEETKYGLIPDNVIDFITKAVEVNNIELKGLMTMAPYTSDTELIRGVFRKLRKLRDQICSLGIIDSFCELSMGMTNDYTIAIEEGATMIRVGSIIFK